MRTIMSPAHFPVERSPALRPRLRLRHISRLDLPARYTLSMQPRGFTFWFRRAISRLALMLGVFCFIELFMHLTEGTKPNIRMPLEYWPYFVTGLGTVSLILAWLTYLPLEQDTPPRDSNRPET